MPGEWKMRRTLMVRLLALWIAFGLGAAVGGWVVSRHAGVCDTAIVDLNIDGLTNAAQAALPAAATGSGEVAFILDFTGIRVHADSIFVNQTYDARVAAVVRGSPATLKIGSKLLRRMLTR